MPLKSRHATKRYVKRGENLWRARAVFESSGQPKELATLGKTKREAESKLSDKIAKLERSETRPGESQTVTELFATVLSLKKSGARPLKASSIRETLGIFKRHVQPYVGDRQIHELDFDELQALQLRLLQQGKRRTAARVTHIVSQIYAYALKRYRRQIAHGELILLDLSDDLEAVFIEKKPKPDLWSRTDLQRFLAASEARYSERVTNLHHAYFYTAIAAGLRRGELLGLPSDAVHYRDILVDGLPVRQAYLDIDRQLVYDGRHFPDTPKSAAGVRQVPVDEAVVKVLETHRERVSSLQRLAPERFEDHGLMFPTRYGKPVHPQTIYRSFYSLLDELSLPRIVPHTLRKIYNSYITEKLLREGKYNPKIPQALLGHATSNVALEVYTLHKGADLQATSLDMGTLRTSGVPSPDTSGVPSPDASGVPSPDAGSISELSGSGSVPQTRPRSPENPLEPEVDDAARIASFCDATPKNLR